MILVRSPLRVTFGGGGTDIPTYYRRFGGYLVSAAIDKYVYIAVVNPFTPGLYLKHSVIESSMDIDGVTSPLIRETLRHVGVNRVAITTFADIPAGTGLGSSGAFTTALLKALCVYSHKPISTEDLASQACHIEWSTGSNCGKQDQYVSAYGGVTSFTFNPDDTVKVRPLKLTADTLDDLSDNLLLFYTGGIRESSSVQVTGDNPATVGSLDYVKDLGLQSMVALEACDLTTFSALLDEQWLAKVAYNPRATSPTINSLYALGKANGALGGKLVGAGGCGFLMFYTPQPTRLRDAMSSVGLVETRFNFDFEGTRVVTA